MNGQTLGGYRITRKIGAGGMGIVYEAEHLLIGRRAAIKCLLPELSHNVEACRRFFIEARAASLISHPSLVEIYDSGHSGQGVAYIIMELLEGEDLGTALRRDGRLALPRAISICRQVASALGAVHKKGIVHRDLKPDNLFLLKQECSPGMPRAKVLDFGIAKLSGPENRQMSVKTRTGIAIGTPSYMSPEQCRGHGTVDFRSDIYSLGCILHEMLTGHPPFRGHGYGEVLAQQIYEPPPRLGSIDPSAPVAMEELILRMLAKNPDLRIPSMEGVAATLDEIELRKRSASFPLPANGHPAQGDATDAATKPEERTSTTLGGSAGESTQKRNRVRLGIPLGFSLGAMLLVMVMGILTRVDNGAEPLSKGLRSSVAQAIPVDEPRAIDASVATPDARPALPEEAPQEAEAVPTIAEAPAERALASCGSALEADPAETRRVKIRIDSDPPGAAIFNANGKLIGKAPHALEQAPCRGTLVFVLKIKRYRTREVRIPGDRSGHSRFKLKIGYVGDIIPL